MMKKQEKYKRSFIDIHQKNVLDKSIKKFELSNS